MVHIDPSIKVLDDIMNELTDVDNAYNELVNESNRRHKEVTDDIAPRMDPIVGLRNALIDRVAQYFQENRDALVDVSTKTVILRSGTLSARFTPEKIVIDDEVTAMKYARKNGMLRRVTKLGKRIFVKDELKKVREFVQKCPGMYFDRPENLLIKLVRTQVEITRVLQPNRRRLN